MEAKLVSGHSKAKKTAHKGRKATHMRIERAENGVMVHTEHEKPEMSRNQKMGMMDSYEPPEAHTFNNRKALMDHIASKFGDVLPEGASDGSKGGTDGAGAESEDDAPMGE